jgi:glycerol-3-phosphate O-acyltransferase
MHHAVTHRGGKGFTGVGIARTKLVSRENAEKNAIQFAIKMKKKYSYMTLKDARKMIKSAFNNLNVPSLDKKIKKHAKKTWSMINASPVSPLKYGRR